MISFLILRIYIGADRHSDIRVDYGHHLVPDTDTQRPQTPVSHRLVVHRVGVFDLHSVRVPKEKIFHCRYV